MLETQTLIGRARRGTSLAQADAARKLGLSRATLCVYEKGEVKPSERKTWEIVAGLALGEPAVGRPKLLLSFALFGQRFLSWGGRLLVLAELDHAQRLADELDDCRLERVVIVPVWPSCVDEIVKREFEGRSERGPVLFEGDEMALDLLFAEVFADLSANAAKWLSEGIPVRPDKAAALIGGSAAGEASADLVHVRSAARPSTRSGN